MGRLGLRWMTAAVACLAMAACGRPLEGMGSFSSAWVRGPEEAVAATAPTTTTSSVPDPELHPASDAQWVNDRLGRPEADGEELIAAVRRREEGAFVQASRYEVAAALEGVQFPAVVPFRVRHVTSQLVYSGDDLDEELLAAFGLWEPRPYSVTRRLGQLGMMTVSAADAAALPEADGEACAGYDVGEGGTCTQAEVAGQPSWIVQRDGAVVLIWGRGDYRYELLCREPVSGELCMEMAGTMVPLAEVDATG